jgi:hypothetical protein
LGNVGYNTSAMAFSRPVLWTDFAFSQCREAPSVIEVNHVQFKN